MGLIENMNYRYNNPDISLQVDSKIVEAFINKARSKDDLEAMQLWASLSNEAPVLEPMLEKTIDNIKEESMTKIA